MESPILKKVTDAATSRRADSELRRALKPLKSSRLGLTKSQAGHFDARTAREELRNYLLAPKTGGDKSHILRLLEVTVWKATNPEHPDQLAAAKLLLTTVGMQSEEGQKSAGPNQITIVLESRNPREEQQTIEGERIG